MWSEIPPAVKRSQSRDMSQGLISDSGSGTYHRAMNTATVVTQGQKCSSGHKYQLLGKTNGNIGGFLLLDQQRYSTSQMAPLSLRSPKVAGDYYTWKGWLKTPSPPGPWELFPAFETNQGPLVVAGTKAISRVLPTNPNASMAVTVGELRRDGIPDMIGTDVFKTRARDFRSMGREYLNVEFGWKPFVSDVKKFADSVRRHDEILRVYYEEADRLIHRQYTFPTTRTFSESTPIARSFGYYNNLSVGSTNPWRVGSTGYDGQYSYSIEDTESIWFSGAFRYHAPARDSSLGSRLQRYKAEADLLYGLDLDPEVLWNLAPWTWAVDWFADVGDVIHNVSAFIEDGLVMQYGYAMRERKVVKKATLSGFNAAGMTSLTGTYESSRKERIAASPFGFGMLEADLTDRQWAILAAIGISTGSGRHR